MLSLMSGLLYLFIRFIPFENYVKTFKIRTSDNSPIIGTCLETITTHCSPNFKLIKFFSLGGIMNFLLWCYCQLHLLQM